MPSLSYIPLTPTAIGIVSTAQAQTHVHAQAIAQAIAPPPPQQVQIPPTQVQIPPQQVQIPPTPYHTQSTQASTSSLTQGQSIKEQIAQNLNNISDDKQKIQEYIQLRNNATDPNIDITTSTARLDYSSLENKSLHLQIILLSSILLIIIIAIITTYMS